jgi:hypothetical protein
VGFEPFDKVGPVTLLYRMILSINTNIILPFKNYKFQNIIEEKKKITKPVIWRYHKLYC